MGIITTEDIKELRHVAGFTQKQLANKAGVSQSLIARIERGTVDPRLSTIRRIFAALTPTKSILTARDIMSCPVESINARDSIRAAIDKMKKTGFSQLPVLLEGRIVGNIHESAILERIARSRNVEHIMSNSIYNVMDKPFFTVDPNESIDKVVNLLSSGQPALLVIENDTILGIITKIDVLSARIDLIVGEK
jgi:predicted transcriptional regulator